MGACLSGTPQASAPDDREEFLHILEKTSMPINVALHLMASRSVQSGKACMVAGVKTCGNAAHYTHKILWSDKHFVLSLMHLDGSAWALASDDLKKDRDILTAACEQQGIPVAESMTVNDLMSAKMSKDREHCEAFIREVEEAEPNGGYDKRKEFFTLMGNASPSVLSDKACILAAVKKCSIASHYAIKKLWSDKNFVLPLMDLDGSAWALVSDHLKMDRDILSAACKQQKIPVAESMTVNDLMSAKVSKDREHCEEFILRHNQDWPIGDILKVHQYLSMARRT